MIFIIVFIFLFLFQLTNNRAKDKLLKYVIYTFLGYWLVALVLSSTNPYGLDSVEVSTYAVLVIYVASFVLGCTVVGNTTPVQTESSMIGTMIDDVTTNKLFQIFVLACDLFLLNLYIKEQALLSIHSAADIRLDLDELLYQGNSFLGLGKNMIIDPLTPVMTFFSSYMLLYNRKKLIPLALVLFYAIIAAFLGGSRGGILRLATYGLFALLCKNYLSPNGRSKMSIGRLFSFSIVVGVVLIVMSNMTSQRLYGTAGFSWDAVILGMDDLSQNFVTYCTGPFRALDHSFTNDYLNTLGGYKYGSCTFGFIDGLIAVFLGPLGVKYTPGFKVVSSYLQENWIDIGGHMFNFAYTAPFMHYMDFGYIGVVLCPFVFGLILRRLVNKFYEHKNPFLLITVAYLFTVAIDSGFTWRLYRHNAGMTLLYLYFLYRIYDRWIVR